MKIEIRHGPLGVEGGEPFPEVREAMQPVSRMRRLMRPGFLRLIPKSMVVRGMRKAFGSKNEDIAKGPVITEHGEVAGPYGSIPVRIYRPEGENLPVLIYYHGGGWVAGSVDTVENVCRALADRARHVVINVDYRLAPEYKFPAGLEDCYAALRWASKHAREWGGDPGRLVVAGDSAGGNFATVCCLLAHERGGPSISHQVLIYPGVDMSGRHLEDMGVDLGERGRLLSRFMASVYVDRPEMLLDPRCSPWLAPDLSFMPPTLMITAEYCFLRDQDEAYAERLEAAGVPTRVIRYNGLNHAFLEKVGVWPYAEGCIDDIAETLTDPGKSVLS